MSETNFTPGPWRTLSDGFVQASNKDWHQGVAHVLDGIPHVPGRLEANAALIAAAPELYEALSGLLAMAEDLAATFPIKPTDDGVSVIDKARAALARALPSPEAK